MVNVVLRGDELYVDDGERLDAGMERVLEWDASGVEGNGWDGPGEPEERSRQRTETWRG